jgi:UDP-glucuronate 4-epimerase
VNTYLITGSAGFIGYHLAERLLAQGHRVVGLDNLNDYYSVELKKARNARLEKAGAYAFHLTELADAKAVARIFEKHDFHTVFHLAAQAGVRYSLERPEAYLKSNIDGTLSVLEAARHARKKPQLLMASSSSVYGLSKRHPFREDDPVDTPISLYGVTKRSNELMGHSYAHLFDMRITMLRFFTVYGPWGRPDMALFKFVKAILAGEEIELYNNGEMVRDFTYVGDIVDGILGLAGKRQNAQLPAFDLFNIGCANARTLVEFVRAIETSLGRKAKVKYGPLQPGDVPKTYADVSKLTALTGYAPKTQIEDGVERFVKWYQEYYR